MEIRLLGPVELVGADGAKVTIGGRKERTLLAVLALHAGTVVSESRLLDALWGDEPPATAGRTLQSHLSRLRKSLATHDVDSSVTLETHPGGWSLRAGPDALDIFRVEAMLESARRASSDGDAVGAALSLGQALRTWRGRPLEEFADQSWALLEAVRLDELHQLVREERIEAEMACGRHAQVIGELEAICTDHPLRERPWELRMLALYRAGRQAEALRVFQEIRRVLGDDLGIDPSPALVRLEQRILDHDPSLDWTGLDPDGRLDLDGSLAPGVVVSSKVEAEAMAPLPLPEFLSTLAGQEFVGRDALAADIDAAWRKAVSGERGVVLIAGEPGIGKTALAAQVARRAADAGAAVLFGRCDEASLVSFQPFVEAATGLVESAPAEAVRRLLGSQAGDLAAVVPAICQRLPETTVPALIGSDGDKYRLFEAVAALVTGLAAEFPVLLVLDDLHWADRPTLGLLHHLVRRTATSRLLVLGTYRDTDLVRTHPMAEALVDLRRSGLVERLILRGLSEAEIVTLVCGQVEPGPADVQLSRALWNETEGSPLFVREILRHLDETGAIRRQDDGRWMAQRRLDQLSIPEGVREVIGRRLTRLTDTANTALRVGSVTGRELRLDVLEVVTGIDPGDLIDALELAVAAGVLVEEPGQAGRWSFTHALVRHTLYDELSLTRRVRLHQHVGEAIEQLDGMSGPALGELAYHFSQAAVGGTADKAVDYAFRAGEHAMELVAYEQAVRYYLMAVEAAEDAGTDPARIAELLLGLGIAQMRSGDGNVARATLRRAAAMPGVRPETVARLALAYAGAGIRPVWMDMFVYNEEAVRMLEDALANLDPSDSELRARLLGALAQELYFGENTERRRDQLSAEAIQVARRLGDDDTLASTLAHRTLAVFGPDHLHEDDNVAELIAIAERLNRPDLLIYGFRGQLMSYRYDQLDEFYRDSERVTALTLETKDPVFRGVLSWVTGLLAAISGDFATAEATMLDAFRHGQEYRDPNSLGAIATVTLFLQIYQGRLAESVGVFHAAAEAYPNGASWANSALAGIYAELGMDRECRRYLDRLDPADTASLPRNLVWVLAQSFLIRAAYRLGDGEKARACYDNLLPFQDNSCFAFSMGTGSVHGPLALAAATAGMLGDAAEHFEAAIAENLAWGLRPCAADMQFYYADTLAQRADAGDRQHALALLDAALQTAEELGMRAIQTRATELRDALSGTVSTKHSRTDEIRRTRRHRAKARVTTRGRRLAARWTRSVTDQELERRFGSNLAQKSLFTAFAAAYQPSMAFGFTGDLEFELYAPDDAMDPATSDWWRIELRGRKASAQRGRSASPAVTVHIGTADFLRLGAGELHPVRALVEGRVTVEGDVMLAARLPDLFGALEDPA